jgi:hypothetical protein
MANLLGQNIGANYRGILNLDATTINTPLNTTLRAVTDGMGNTSQLFLSTTQVNIGGGSSTGRLTIRGDGTTPVARFENSSGVTLVRVTAGTNNEVMQFGSSNVQPPVIRVLGQGGNASLSGNWLEFAVQNGDNTSGNIAFKFNGSSSSFGNISGVSSLAYFDHLFGAAAGLGNYRHISFNYIINNSGAQTGVATGIHLNATETNLNGMTHNLMQLQINGVDAMSVSRTGLVSCSGVSFASLGASNGRLLASSNGAFVLYNSAANTFNRLQFGGQDSLFAQIAVQGTVGGTNTDKLIICLADSTAGGALGVGMARATGVNVSAVLQADSTTKGFLPPRMTTTEVNNIGTPAEGLVVYNTTIGHLCVRAGGVWHKINHSTM